MYIANSSRSAAVSFSPARAIGHREPTQKVIDFPDSILLVVHRNLSLLDIAVYPLGQLHEQLVHLRVLGRTYLPVRDVVVGGQSIRLRFEHCPLVGFVCLVSDQDDFAERIVVHPLVLQPVVSSPEALSVGNAEDQHDPDTVGKLLGRSQRLTEGVLPVVPDLQLDLLGCDVYSLSSVFYEIRLFVDLGQSLFD